MPPSPPPDGRVRSAEELNAAIRALLERTRRRLSDAEREEYEQLVVEWEAAKRSEVTTAA